MDVNLSGTQVTKISGCPVYPYHDLTKYIDLEEMLGNKAGFTILYEQKYNDGHYCAVLLQPDGLEFFDSYGSHFSGGGIDSELKYSPYDLHLVKNKYFTDDEHGTNHTLKHLISDYTKKHNIPLIVNTYDYQSDHDGVNTCGRWSGYRIRKHDLTLPEFKNLGLTDQSIVKITNQFL